MKHTAIRTKSNQIVSFLFVFGFASFRSLTKYISDLLDIVLTGSAELLKNITDAQTAVATVVEMSKRRKKINKFT